MTPPRLSKEQQVLFDLLKGDPPASLVGIDTNSLFSLFRRHRLFPLSRTLLPLLDDKDTDRWMQALQQGSVRSLALTSRLLEVTERLETEGIEVLPLKGPVLAQALYGDISQRHMRDLDLLVSQENLVRALKILQGMGYGLKFPSKELSSRQWRIYFRQQYDVALVHSEDGSFLELHTRIAYPGLLGGLEHLLFEDKEVTELANREVRCMSKEGTFLYLAIHGAHHLFFRLFWLRDLSEAVRRWDMDHARITTMAQQMGIERMLGVGLRLAESYFGTSIPKEYEQLLTGHDLKLQSMEQRCHRAISDPHFYGSSSRRNVLLYSMDHKAGWKHKWQTLISVIRRWYIRSFLVR